MPDERPPSISLAPKAIAAILLLLVLAHFVHAYLKLGLQNQGIGPEHSYNLSYFVVPLILLPSLLLILRDNTGRLRQMLDPRRLDLRLAVAAIALGVLLRVVYWAQLVVRVSFGLGTESSPGDTIGPLFSFDCPPVQVIALGFLTMAMLVPVTEEVIHRGIIQSAFADRGACLSVIVSAGIFAIFHRPSSYVFVFVAGIVLGTQFWRSRTLLATMITHATYNGLVQLDWICLRGHWVLAEDDIPAIRSGGIAALVGIIACVGVVRLLIQCRPGHKGRPGPPG